MNKDVAYITQVCWPLVMAVITASRLWYREWWRRWATADQSTHRTRRSRLTSWQTGNRRCPATPTKNVFFIPRTRHRRISTTKSTTSDRVLHLATTVLRTGRLPTSSVNKRRKFCSEMERSIRQSLSSLYSGVSGTLSKHIKRRLQTTNQSTKW